MNNHTFLDAQKRKRIKQLRRSYIGVSARPYKKVKRIVVSLDRIVIQPINYGCHNPREAKIKQQIQSLKNKIKELESLL